MTYAGVQMFMEKLNQLLNRNDIPLFNNPAIIWERPQFRLLYDELGSIIQTLFSVEHQGLEKVNDLKQRFIYAAEEAQYIVDLFLSSVQIRSTERSPRRDYVRRSSKSVVNRFLSCLHIRNNEDFSTSEGFSSSLNLDDVRRSLKSVEVEFMSIKIGSKKKMDSSKTTLKQSVAGQSSISRNSLGSKKVMDEIFVGIDGDAEIIRDKLVEDQKKLDVVSIVGMGGIGKTTLATKVFNDGYVKHHFYLRAWVTISQTYDKRGVLTQILEAIRDQLHLEKASDSRLREMVHKHLMGKRYLIVIDDIWDIEAWDNIKLFFPHNNTGSRILLTSRLTEVAKHAHSNGLIHHLGYLNKERSWELLCQKVFRGKGCPEWSIKPGMQIVESCQGLPLAVVVIAGVLAKNAWSKKFWREIADKTGPYIVGDKNGCLETLGLSYNRLPLHLRECFLYLGGFAEDYMFKVRELVMLWVAEGFIQQDGNRSLEDIAEGYLTDLIDRNLVMVAGRSKSNGGIKACKVHDLVRELCLRKAKEEQFILTVDRQCLCHTNTVITPPYKPVRMFIERNINISDYPYPCARHLQSISLSSYLPTNFRSFLLLRVLDLQNCKLANFPYDMKLLVHLRYLAIWSSSSYFPTSICNLWSLQTLIYISDNDIDLPGNISDLVNLRHLWSFLPFPGERMKPLFVLRSIEKPMNLKTISNVQLSDKIDNLQRYFPYINELTCYTYFVKENDHYDFKSLTHLEKLKFTRRFFYREAVRITFPATLKTLALNNCHLPWSVMSSIQSLPYLQVLKLKHYAFEGSCWNTDGQEFRQLKFLILDELDIKQWEAYSASFPCLRQLEIFNCKDLEEIPIEIGDIPTLELINIDRCRQSVGDSVRRIEEEQNDLGNYDLKIDIIEEIEMRLDEYEARAEWIRKMMAVINDGDVAGQPQDHEEPDQTEIK